MPLIDYELLMNYMANYMGNSWKLYVETKTIMQFDSLKTFKKGFYCFCLKTGAGSSRRRNRQLEGEELPVPRSRSGSCSLVGLIDHIVAVGREDEGVGEGFVEGALPPLIVGIAVPAETFGRDAGAAKVEDTDLLTWM